MKALSDVKLAYVIRKIKDTFCLKEHTHEKVENAENANHALSAEIADSLAADYVVPIKNGGVGSANVFSSFAQASSGFYTGTGTKKLNLGFPENFYPFLIMIHGEGSFGSPLILLRSMAANSFDNGLGNLGNPATTDGDDAVSTSTVSYTPSGKTVDGVKYNVITINTNSESANVTHLYNRSGLKYTYVALGLNKMNDDVPGIEILDV